MISKVNLSSNGIEKVFIKNGENMEVLTYSRINKNGRLIEFTYSECDRELVESYTWGYRRKDYLGTSITIDKKEYKKFLHRLIMGEPEGMMVDHIDGNPKNNTRENLRICTRSQNGMNCNKRSHNKSGTKGVNWHKASNKWVAQIRINKKVTYLGTFGNIEDAIKVRQDAEEKYYGEFRRKD